ncbi:GGDEF domain-containing protein [Consotaella aegiceratis]|uniref:GGDEF domain-containing protein n=1 Tax=Consotaella aegiceratis TaxID=3097961 RepID=UPI002F3ECC8B
MSRGDFSDQLPTLGVALVATLFGTGLTIYAVSQMMATTGALDRYAAERELPNLPSSYGDAAGRLMARVQTVVVDLDNCLGELETQAATDPLTGLANRRWLSASGNQEVNNARRKDGKLSMLLIDVDNFKALNDVHGHEVGDRALIVVADAIRACIRDSDRGVRLGGDEFCVVLPDVDGATAKLAGERIREAARRASSDILGTDCLTLSVGVTSFGPSDRSFLDLYRRADRSLYRAKASGRDQLTFG